MYVCTHRGRLEVKGEAMHNTRDNLVVTFAANKLTNQGGFFGTSNPFLKISRCVHTAKCNVYGVICLCVQPSIRECDSCVHNVLYFAAFPILLCALTITSLHCTPSFTVQVQWGRQLHVCMAEQKHWRQSEPSLVTNGKNIHSVHVCCATSPVSLLL